MITLSLVPPQYRHSPSLRSSHLPKTVLHTEHLFGSIVIQIVRTSRVKQHRDSFVNNFEEYTYCVIDT